MKSQFTKAIKACPFVEKAKKQANVYVWLMKRRWALSSSEERVGWDTASCL